MSDSKAKIKRQLGIITTNFIQVVNNVALHAERKVRAGDEILAVDEILYKACSIDMDKLRKFIKKEQETQTLVQPVITELDKEIEKLKDVPSTSALKLV